MVSLTDESMSLEAAKRFHYLYQRASSDLVKLQTFAGEVEASQFLENLVGRAYSRLHVKRASAIRFKPWDWIARVLPSTFRRHAGAFWISFSWLMFSCLLGAGLMVVAPEKKMMFLGGFGHLKGKPSERVAKEEREGFDGFEGRSSFASMLMTHNTRVALRVMVGGITFGVLTVWFLMTNGVMLGIIIFDYIADGQSVFLTAWLLPHGSVEIPAIIFLSLIHISEPTRPY